MRVFILPRWTQCLRVSYFVVVSIFCNIRVPSIAASRPRMKYATSYRTDENHLLTLET